MNRLVLHRNSVIFTALLVLLTFAIPALGYADTFDNDGIMFKAYGPELVRQPATEVPIRVLTANLQQNNKALILEKITIIGPQGKPIRKVSVDKSLNNISDRIDTVDSFKALLGFKGQHASEEQRHIHQDHLKEILENLSKSEHRIKLKEIKPDLKVGDSLTFKIIGTFSSSGKTIQRVETLSVTYAASLPSISGWYPGDGHIHTAFSDAPLYSVDERANDATY